MFVLDYRVNFTIVNVTVSGVIIPFLSVNNWIVIQYRFDGSLSFNRIWSDYRQGFGSSDSEFWIGLNTIYQLTSAGTWMLRLEVKNHTDHRWWDREYYTFYIDSEALNYTLHVSLTSYGSMTDVLNMVGVNYQNGMQFSTSDRDNDHYYTKCAVVHMGGFWYNGCYGVNPNGNYTSTFRFVQYYGIVGSLLESSRLMIKRVV